MVGTLWITIILVWLLFLSLWLSDLSLRMRRCEKRRRILNQHIGYIYRCLKELESKELDVLIAQELEKEVKKDD